MGSRARHLFREGTIDGDYAYFRWLLQRSFKNAKSLSTQENFCNCDIYYWVSRKCWAAVDSLLTKRLCGDQMPEKRIKSELVGCNKPVYHLNDSKYFRSLFENNWGFWRQQFDAFWDWSIKKCFLVTALNKFTLVMVSFWFLKVKRNMKALVQKSYWLDRQITTNFFS